MGSWSKFPLKTRPKLLKWSNKIGAGPSTFGRFGSGWGTTGAILGQPEGLVAKFNVAASPHSLQEEGRLNLGLGMTDNSFGHLEEPAAKCSVVAADGPRPSSGSSFASVSISGFVPIHSGVVS